MHILVASENPVKIKAVELGFQKIFGSEISYTIEGKKVSSNVPDQPVGDEETRKGAYERVQELKKLNIQADFYVGLEGGIDYTPHGILAIAWTYIESSDCQAGQGKAPSFFLPPQMTELLQQGKELGEASDILFHENNAKQKMGTIGILTHNAIDRVTYCVDMVALALIPFINKKLYNLPYNIYFSGSIRGGREDQVLYEKIIELLQPYGKILTEHVGQSGIENNDAKVYTETEIYDRDMQWLGRSDIIVAEITTPSLGVGYELTIAEMMKKPILCLYRNLPNKKISAMILGNKAYTLKSYENEEDVSKILEDFFKQL